MKLVIHRGAKEIGGSCVEIRSAKTRVIVDLGMPLVNAQDERFDSKVLEGKSISDLVKSHLLPKVNGLYAGEEKEVDAVLISHPHQDHYGLLSYINPTIPVHMSRGAKALIEVSDIFIPTKANLHNVSTFKMWQQFTIGDLIITPHLVDHSAFDAAAFLIAGEGERIVYSGDFRGHGRKRILFDNMISHPIKDVDYLLLEGSMLGRGENRYPNERAVEDKMVSAFRNKNNIAFVFCSSQNIDRIVSVYRAAKRTGQTLVIDLYTAFILDRLKDISDKLPQYWWQDAKVIYFKNHAKTLADNGLKGFLYDCKSDKIEKKGIDLNRKNIVMITKDNYDFTELLTHISDFQGARAIYSMWEGYLENSDLDDRLKQKNVQLELIHTSGHATAHDLQTLAQAFKPRCLIPIHTFYPQEYPSLFENVHILNDDEELIL